MSRNNSRDRGGASGARKKRSSWSSDEFGIVDNNARRRQRGRSSTNEGRQGQRPYSSPSLDSNDSGSSIETDIDRCSKQAQHQRDGNTAAGHLTHGGEIRIVKSLQRKLLSNNGARLSRIERRLLRTDRKRNGVVSISAFEAALAVEKKPDNRAVIGRDEVRWLTRKLRGRNGKSVAILRMRALLEPEETGRKRQPGRKGQVERHQYHHHHYHDTSQCGRSSRGSERRRRGNGSTAGDGEEGRGGTTSESTCSGSGRGDASWKRRSSPPPPARWAIRQGTVGHWLHEVAAPMERKLFFEFIKDLEKFELRNGLDHYRVRPSPKARRRNGSSGDDDDGTTVLHLGPMLKASIKFYV